MRSPTSASLSRFGASTRTREFGERRTLIGFLPEATHLRRPTRRFHLLSIGAQGPDNLSVLADPAGPLHQRHVRKLREVTDEDRPLGPERQVVRTSNLVETGRVTAPQKQSRPTWRCDGISKKMISPGVAEIISVTHDSPANWLSWI
jgi:hypothetical protein